MRYVRINICDLNMLTQVDLKTGRKSNKMRLILFYTVLLLTSNLALAKKHLVILGDSLTEGYNLPKEESFPSQLEAILNSNKNNNIKVTNAGVSGSTSASGVSRLKWLLRSKPTHLIIALGSNDGLRGIQPEDTEKNLKKN